MNPDSDAINQDTLVKMAQAINIVTDVEPSVTCSGDQDNLDETSACKDSSILEHHEDSPIYTDEYMVPSRENAELWQSISESEKLELNMTQMIPL